MNLLKEIIALLQTDPSSVIVALGTFVTALASAIVLLVNLFRQKRIEKKIDSGAQIQADIHTAVNGGKALLLAEIVDLKAQIKHLTEKTRSKDEPSKPS